MKLKGSRNSQLGYTLIELMVVLALGGILTGFATVNLLEMANPARNGAAVTVGFLKEVRAKALASTSAYHVSASSTSRLVTRSGATCADPDHVSDPDLEVGLPEGASFSDITWSICFSSRGFPDSNVIIPISDIYEGDENVEVLLGGSVRIQ